MKKVILAIFGIALFSIACNKIQTTIEPTTSQTIKQTRSSNGTFTFNEVIYTIANGILTFETFEKYESIVNNENRDVLIQFANHVENSQLVKNYYSMVNQNAKEQYEFLGKLLNSKGFIKIDDYLILIDFQNSKVYAQKNGNVFDINETKNGNIQSGVLIYQIGDDVLEELKINKTRGVFCGAPWQEKFEKWPSDGAIPTYLGSVQYTPGGTVTLPIQINTSVKYWPAGIYFELNSRVVVTPAGVPLATAPFSYITTYSCKRRCGNTFSGTSTRSFANASNDKNIMYWNVRALTQGYTTISSTVSSSASIPSGATRTAYY